MDPKPGMNKVGRVILAILAGVFGLSCLCLPTGIAATPTISVAPTASNPATQPPAISTQPAGIGSVPLNSSGPWLLIETDMGLWATNPDGTGLTQLTTTDFWHGELSAAIQPGGSQVVFVSPGNFNLNHMALNLLTLPDGKITRLTALTSAQTETYNNLGNPGFDALRAIGEQHSYAWSPDGKTLAFIGLMDGPSADLYLYDVAQQKIQRVSQDPDQDFSPSWSPDGKQILYLEAKGFGTGAGMVMAGVWASGGDGSNVRELYATQSSGEEMVGWLNNTTAVLDTWNIDCGSGNLRLYDVISQQQKILSEGCVASSTTNSGNSQMIFANDKGLFIFSDGNQLPVQLSTEANARIEPWGPDDSVFKVNFQDGSLATYGTSDIEHQTSPVKVAQGDLELAEYGLIWGWTSLDPTEPGAWITGPGVEIGRIYDGAAGYPAWDLHNNLLFFAVSDSGGYDLYRTTFDSHYTDLVKVDQIPANIISVFWLGPKNIY